MLDPEVLSPIAIGGVGGSGTRLIAQILRASGFFLGSDLNSAEDNLWFTLLFKRREVLAEPADLFEKLLELFLERMAADGFFSSEQQQLVRGLAQHNRPQHTAGWLAERAESLLERQHRPPSVLWGWKEPNTHVVLDRLIQALPNLRYIHVVRNGLDMAYSRNQNQLQFWGDHFLGPGWNLGPYHSLRFWRVVHERVLRLGDQMGPRFLFLHYDTFCRNPIESTRRLLKFAGVDLTPGQVAALAGLVRIPDSVGRFRDFDLNMFDPGDVAFVRQLGFDTG